MGGSSGARSRASLNFGGVVASTRHHETTQQIYDAFGPQRLMWGTDFPHVLLDIGYIPALDLFREHMGFLNDDDKEWLFSKTALSVWNFQ